MIEDSPLRLTSPNAPRKRDVLGTVLLGVLAGCWRYAHLTALRGDGVNPPLLGDDEGAQRGRGASRPGAAAMVPQRSALGRAGRP